MSEVQLQTHIRSGIGLGFRVANQLHVNVLFNVLASNYVGFKLRGHIIEG